MSYSWGWSHAVSRQRSPQIAHGRDDEHPIGTRGPADLLCQSASETQRSDPLVSCLVELHRPVSETAIGINVLRHG